MLLLLLSRRPSSSSSSWVLSVTGRVLSHVLAFSGGVHLALANSGRPWPASERPRFGVPSALSHGHETLLRGKTFGTVSVTHQAVSHTVGGGCMRRHRCTQDTCPPSDHGFPRALGERCLRSRAVEVPMPRPRRARPATPACRKQSGRQPLCVASLKASRPCTDRPPPPSLFGVPPRAGVGSSSSKLLPPPTPTLEETPRVKRISI